MNSLFDWTPYQDETPLRTTWVLHDLGYCTALYRLMTAVIGEFVGMAVEQGGNLRLDGLRQQRPRAVAQHLGQRIGECPWLAELENITLGHGVSLLRWRSGSFEHPHDTPPQPLMPSPTFADSSPQCSRRQ